MLLKIDSIKPYRYILTENHIILDRQVVKTKLYYNKEDLLEVMWVDLNVDTGKYVTVTDVVTFMSNDKEVLTRIKIDNLKKEIGV